MAIDNAVYTAHATSTGGRTGTSSSSDRRPSSSRKTMSPKSWVPRISEGKSRPKTVMLSGVL
jgi:organic hydroperoxide reductase OsmC/OhrA